MAAKVNVRWINVIWKWMTSVWLLAVSLSSAAEIVAWRVPLKSICPDGLSSKEVSRREVLPAATVFFGEKDELWDVRLKDDPKCPGALEGLDWLVWNETRKMFVACGGWVGLSALHGILGPKRSSDYCKLKLDIQSIKTGAAGRVESPVPSPEVLIESGHRIESKWKENGIEVEIDADAVIGDLGGLADLRLFCSVTVPGQPSIQLNTSFVIVEGKRMLVVRDEDGVKGLALWVTGTWVTADGGSPAEQVLIQSGGNPSPLFPPAVRPLKIVEVKGFGWLASSAGTSPGDLLAFMKRKNGEVVPEVEINPFTENPNQLVVRFPGDESIKPPECIRPWMKHELVDARQLIRELALPVPVPEFAGYDPMVGRFYFFDKNEETVRNHRINLSALDSDCDLVHHCGISIEGRGSSYLIARTGQRASFSRNIGDAVLRDCELEPMYSESDEATDLRMEWNDRHADGETHLKSSTTLKNGKFQEVLSGQDGKPGLRLKSDLISP